MRATVDEDLCIGCGVCEQMCPEIYELVDGIAQVNLDPIPSGQEQICQDAADACPVDAIIIQE